MRRAAFLLLLLSCCAVHFLAAQTTDTVRINGSTFVFKKITRRNEEYSDHKDTIWKLYRLREGKVQLLLEHPAYQWSADCNNVFEDYGTYNVSGDTVFFSIRYTQERSDPIPTRREQAYIVNTGGKLLPLYDRTYDWNDELMEH